MLNIGVMYLVVKVKGSVLVEKNMRCIHLVIAACHMQLFEPVSQ